jgi:hypothetical protein
MPSVRARGSTHWQLRPLPSLVDFSHTAATMSAAHEAWPLGMRSWLSITSMIDISGARGGEAQATRKPAMVGTASRVVLHMSFLEFMRGSSCKTFELTVKVRLAPAHRQTINGHGTGDRH